MNLKEIEKKVIERIKEKELVELATALGNITAPSGYEQPMADYVEVNFCFRVFAGPHISSRRFLISPNRW